MVLRRRGIVIDERAREYQAMRLVDQHVIAIAHGGVENERAGFELFAAGKLALRTVELELPRTQSRSPGAGSYRENRRRACRR